MGRRIIRPDETGVFVIIPTALRGQIQALAAATRVQIRPGVTTCSTMRIEIVAALLAWHDRPDPAVRGRAAQIVDRRRRPPTTGEDHR